MDTELEKYVEEFVKEFQNNTVNQFILMNEIVTAYAGSAKCDPDKIPQLYLTLFAFFKDGKC